MKLIKRVLACCFAIMLISSTITTTAFALVAGKWTNDSFSLTNGTVVVDATTNVDVAINFKNNIDIEYFSATNGTFSLKAYKDSSCTEETDDITLTAMTPASSFTLGPLDGNNAQSGNFSFTDGTNRTIANGSIIWTATYSVAANTAIGTYYVKLSPVAISDLYGNSMSNESYIATIEVTQPAAPKEPYEIYYTLDSNVGDDAFKDYEVVDENGDPTKVDATIYMVSNNADVTLQAYDIYLTHDSKLKYSGISMDGADALTNGGAGATATAGLTHLQLVAKNKSITLTQGEAKPLGKVTFTIDPSAEYGEDLKITLTPDATNISIANTETVATQGDTTSYHPNVIQTVNGVTYSGAEIATKYDVTFDTDNGSVVDAQEVGHNQYATDPGTPTKDGYEFKGWFADANKTTKFAFDTNKITADTIIYAKWEQKAFTVKWYDADGNELTDETQTDVTSGSTLEGTDAKPEKQDTAEWDYTFIGWNTDKTANTALDLTNYTVSGNLEFYPIYSSVKRSYTVTWKNEDGTVLETDTVLYGTVPTFDGETPTKAATTEYTYAFDKWTPEIVVVTGEAVYTATYTSTTNQYTVTFSDGTQAKTVDYNTSISLPKAVDKVGHTFNSWNTKEDGSGTSYNTGASYIVTANVTLYAQYTPDTYKVTLYPNSGTIAEGKDITSYTYGVGATLPVVDDMTREGYTFAGWYTNSELTGDSVNAITTTDTGEKSFWAKWTANPYSATVDPNLDTSKGTVTVANSDGESGISAKVGDTMNLTAKPEEGYAFDSWTVTDVNGNPIEVSDNKFTMPAANVIVSATFSPIDYTATAKNEAGAKGNVTTEKTEGLHVGETATFAVKPETGYKVTSVSYYKGEDTANTTPIPVGSDGNYSFQMPASDITVTATFAPIAYKVSFTGNGGTADEGATIEDIDAVYDTEDTLPENIYSKTGYSFDGWAKEDGTKVDKLLNLTTTDGETVTLKAIWKANQYTVTLDAKGGAVTPSTATVTYGETYPTMNDATRAGYTFDGWYDAETGGTKITAETVVNTADNHTLYAYWTANKYNVTLDHNYTGSTNGSVEVEYDKTYADLTNPVRDGYTFDGWYTAAEGGNKVNSNDTVKIEANTTLYAHWNVVTYNVKLIVPEDTALNGTMVSYDIEKGGTLSTPSNGLFTFKEWKVTKAYGNWALNDTFTNNISNGFYGSSDETEKQEYVELTAVWNFKVLHGVEDYKYAYNTKDATGGYVMLRVADNLDSGKEYMFGDTSMYYTEDPNYLLNDTDTNYTGVFYLLIGEEYFDSTKNVLNADGEKLLKVANATSRTVLLTDGENKWDINGDNAVNIADANIVYQMVQNGGAYYSYDDGQNDGQLDNKHRLMADLATATDDTDNEHRASIMDVNAIVNQINGVVETTNP